MGFEGLYRASESLSSRGLVDGAARAILEVDVRLDDLDRVSEDPALLRDVSFELAGARELVVAEALELQAHIDGASRSLVGPRLDGGLGEPEIGGREEQEIALLE
jgi:hypothetical protein